MERYIKQTTAKWDAQMAKTPGIPLWPQGQVPGLLSSVPQREPSIVPFLAQGDEPRGAVIICAGGAYWWKEPPEGHSHAKWLNAHGLHAFVLDYRVRPYKSDCALQDVQRAVRTLRHSSGDWNIKKDKICILGFSSGGHLSAMASTHFDCGDPASDDPVERESCRPDAQALCYPCITFAPFTYDPDFMTGFFGAGYTQADVDRLSTHLYVRPDTPPAFLWGMGGDYQYKQNQWGLYTAALEEKGVPFSYHLFPGGAHAEGRRADSPIFKQWTVLCKAWLKELGF